MASVALASRNDEIDEVVSSAQSRVAITRPGSGVWIRGPTGEMTTLLRRKSLTAFWIKVIFVGDAMWRKTLIFVGLGEILKNKLTIGV